MEERQEQEQDQDEREEQDYLDRLGSFGEGYFDFTTFAEAFTQESQDSGDFGEPQTLTG